MLRIHHVPAARGFRIIRPCEELHMPHEIVPVDFFRATVIGISRSSLPSRRPVVVVH